MENEVAYTIVQAGRAVEGMNDAAQYAFGVDFFYPDVDTMNEAANSELGENSRYARVTIEYFDSEADLRAAIAAGE